MSDQGRTRKGGRLTALMAASLVIGAYIGGYFWLSKSFDLSFVGLGTIRDFESSLMCRIYWPLGWCECKITRQPVLHRRPRNASDVHTISTGDGIMENQSYFDP